MLLTLRTGGGGGGFIIGGFGGGPDGRPGASRVGRAIESDDWNMAADDGGPRIVPKWLAGKVGAVCETGGDLGLRMLWCRLTVGLVAPLPTSPAIASCMPGGFGARFGLP